MAAVATTSILLSDFVSAAGAAASVVKSANSVESSPSAPIDPQTTLSPSASLSSSSSSLSASTVSSTLASVAPSPITTFPSTATNEPRGHVAQKKIAIGVVVPIVVIALILSGLWAWRKLHRRNPNEVIEKGSATLTEEIQPYLQQKAELEDDARRRHELDAQERRYEKDGNEIFELPERHSRHDIPQRHSRRPLNN